MANSMVSVAHASFPTVKGQTMNVLVIEARGATKDSPVVLFLHGRGESCSSITGLPLVLRNMSPGFQAIQERLLNATIVSPQVPRDDVVWNWSEYVDDLGNYVRDRFARRRVVGVGFSRGGLGILQLDRVHPDLIDRWGIVDPQRAEPDEEALLLPTGPGADGWLRFGNHLPQNTPFALRLAQKLRPENAAFVDMTHGNVASAAFSGEQLDGSLELRECQCGNGLYAAFEIGPKRDSEKRRPTRLHLYEYLDLQWT